MPLRIAPISQTKLLKSGMEFLNKKSNRWKETSTLYIVKYAQEGELLMDAERL